MQSKSGYIFNIQHFSINDGPGIRTTVFLKGCPLQCAWCHNPESQLFEPEGYTQTNRMDNLEFKVDEVVGKSMGVAEVMKEIEKDIAIYDESGGGVTFSGGEPLAQPQFLQQLLMACNAKEIRTAIDTSGFASRAVMEQILPHSQLFLFDLKLADEKQHIEYTGVSNNIILENLALIIQHKKEVIIRIPLIEDITDTPHNLSQLREIIKQYPSIQRVDLLPFHNIAKSKYQRFGRKYTLPHARPYNLEKAEEAKRYFSDVIPHVTIGA